MHLVDATRSMKAAERRMVCGRVARGLIKNVCEEEGDHKQAVEMWTVFNKRFPDEVTDKDYPQEP